MTTAEIKKQLKQGIIWGGIERTGGQSTNPTPPHVRMRQEELGLDIMISVFRNQLSNKGLCIKIYNLVVEEYLKN